jgi:hypothetical protein
VSKSTTRAEGQITPSDDHSPARQTRLHAGHYQGELANTARPSATHVATPRWPLPPCGRWLGIHDVGHNQARKRL